MVKKKGGKNTEEKINQRKKERSFVTKKRAFERDCLNKWDELGEEEKKKKGKIIRVVSKLIVSSLDENN